MMRTPLVVGNWKMHTTLAEAEALARGVAAAKPAGVEVAVCPPFPWLVPVARLLAGSEVGVGAQNCWTEPAGAVTGEVSPAMLREWCHYVLAGHSERRALLGEDDELVAAKVKAILDHDLTPILCVGETLAQREAGGAAATVGRQLSVALARRDTAELHRCVVAYEPVWAIGTGVAATPDDAAEMATLIRATLADFDAGAAGVIRILYGGSVSPDNAADLLAATDVDGALVGGASLKADAFAAIAAAARRE